MVDLFKGILDDDEKIIKAYKPNKLRFYFLGFFILLLSLIFIFGIITIMYFSPDEEVGQMPFYVFYVVGGAAVIYAVIFVILMHFSYKKRYYAYTNKRILISNGIVGIDYKGLDHMMIGATEVRVDFLDKLLRKNTGTLKFGSQASPMHAGGSAFSFSGVVDPYNIYREIKNYIDEIKKED